MDGGGKRGCCSLIGKRKKERKENFCEWCEKIGKVAGEEGLL